MTAKKILVIDDDPICSGVLLAIIGDEHQVISANSGSSALEILTTFKPDLILLDINMPNINGYQVVKLVKNNPLTSNIPIIIISSLAEDSDKEFGLKIGADDYLTKPIMPDAIETTLAKYLDH
ncbi:MULTISPECIES: response regulator [Pseudomonadati]|uniref:Response regulator n=1 Tax=Shewanella aestuarii TaxID=1028752 RepID=A0ABT0KYB5_9GAMM|nr:response regulator [Shewanella aestuarii]MCL1116457.1 response regulator [Shewanella aestuarii]GGN71568.1 hypothetical protein GCM10009193_07610 [Shewanella aestuarii]